MRQGSSGASSLYRRSCARLLTEYNRLVNTSGIPSDVLKQLLTNLKSIYDQYGLGGNGVSDQHTTPLSKYGTTTSNDGPLFQEIGISEDLSPFLNTYEITRIKALNNLKNKVKATSIDYFALTQSEQILLSTLGNFNDDTQSYGAYIWGIRDDFDLPALGTDTLIDAKFIDKYLEQQLKIATIRKEDYKAKAELLAGAISDFVGMLGKQANGDYITEYKAVEGTTGYMYNNIVSNSMYYDIRADAEYLFTKYFKNGASVLREFDVLGQAMNFSSIVDIINGKNIYAYVNAMGPIWELNQKYETMADMAEDLKMAFTIISAVYFSYFTLPNLLMSMTAAFVKGGTTTALKNAILNSVVSLGAIDDANDIMGAFGSVIQGDVKSAIVKLAFAAVPNAIGGINTVAKRATKEAIDKSVKELVEKAGKAVGTEVLAKDVLESYKSNFGLAELNKLTNNVDAKVFNTGGSLQMNLQLFAKDAQDLIDIDGSYFMNLDAAYLKNSASLGSISKKAYFNESLELATRATSDTNTIIKTIDGGQKVVYDKISGKAVIIKDGKEITDYIKLDAGKTEAQVLEAVENAIKGMSNLVTDVISQTNKQAINAMTSFDDEVVDLVGIQGLTLNEFTNLRLTSAEFLEVDDIQKLVNIRQSIPHPISDTLMSKAISKQARDNILVNGQYSDTVGGFVARAQDMKSASTYDDYFNQLRLDYKETPYNPDTDDFMSVIRFMTDDVDALKVPYGGVSNADIDAMALATGMDKSDLIKQAWPYSGNGFTVSTTNVTIPEYVSKPNMFMSIKDGSVMYDVYKDGTEFAVATFIDGVWVPID